MRVRKTPSSEKENYSIALLKNYNRKALPQHAMLKRLGEFNQVREQLGKCSKGKSSFASLAV